MKKKKSKGSPKDSGTGATTPSGAGSSGNGGQVQDYLLAAYRSYTIAKQCLYSLDQPAPEACVQLYRAWRAFGCACAVSAGSSAVNSSGEIEDVARLIPPAYLLRLDSHTNKAANEEWKSDLSQLEAIYTDEDPLADAAYAWTEERIRYHLLLLQKAIRLLNSEDERKRGVKPLWLRIIPYGVGAVACIAIVYASYLFLRKPAPWHAVYFQNAELTGSPLHTRKDEKIDFRWNDKPPFPDFKNSFYSARWTSCLVLKENALVTFELTSDDGSRLFVDNESVIDSWKPQAATAQSAARQLNKGLHAVRVEYFQNSGLAEAGLKAAVAGSKLDFLSRNYLIYPGDTINSQNPCPDSLVKR